MKGWTYTLIIASAICTGFLTAPLLLPWWAGMVR